jgi:hypothetical protein
MNLRERTVETIKSLRTPTNPFENSTLHDEDNRRTNLIDNLFLLLIFFYQIEAVVPENVRLKFGGESEPIQFARC